MSARPKARRGRSSQAIPGGVKMTMPWRDEPTAPGEAECWEDLYDDLDWAHTRGLLDTREYRWFAGMLGEMFREGLRTPWYVMAARICFLYTDTGEA